MLEEQYRMHPEIAAFPSSHVYNNFLRSHRLDTVYKLLLCCFTSQLVKVYCKSYYNCSRQQWFTERLILGCEVVTFELIIALKLQLQNRTCKLGAIFIAICRRDIAGVSNMFET